MDINSIIAIAVLIVVIYLFIKFIVSPIVKAILGIVIFLALIYFLKRFFNFDLDGVLSPFGIHLNWIFGPIEYYINLAENFINFIWHNFINAAKK